MGPNICNHEAGNIGDAEKKRIKCGSAKNGLYYGYSTNISRFVADDISALISNVHGNVDLEQSHEES